MKANILISQIAFCLTLFMLLSCGSGNTTTDESPTQGKTKISVDESYQLIIDTQIYTFESLYRYASITPQYKSEAEVIEDFMNDSVKVIVTNRKLSKQQEEWFLTNKKFTPRTTLIAYDALAIIINKENNDTLLKYTILKDIFSGKITKWSEINSSNNIGDLNVIFDNNKSGNPRFVREKFEITGNYPKNFFAVNNNVEVINYVEKNKSALGIISVNWISDKHDTLSKAFLKKVKVCAISTSIEPDGPYYYKPYQGFIATKQYPLVREVYMINREIYAGLGSGFTSFVAGDQGQRIILKSGLLPASVPLRLIKVKNK